MQDPSTYVEAFQREHGCTPHEWLGWLPVAVAPHAWQAVGPDGARIRLGDGALHLQWQILPPRRIALIRMPRLHVSYRFENVPADDRVRFMRHFDLSMQRGGG